MCLQSRLWLPARPLPLSQFLPSRASNNGSSNRPLNLLIPLPPQPPLLKRAPQPSHRYLFLNCPSTKRARFHPLSRAPLALKHLSPSVSRTSRGRRALSFRHTLNLVPRAPDFLSTRQVLQLHGRGLHVRALPGRPYHLLAQGRAM